MNDNNLLFLAHKYMYNTNYTISKLKNIHSKLCIIKAI